MTALKLTSINRKRKHYCFVENKQPSNVKQIKIVLYEENSLKTNYCLTKVQDFKMAISCLEDLLYFKMMRYLN